MNNLAEMKKGANIVDRLRIEDLDPEYYMMEARALANELEKGIKHGFMSNSYAMEKMAHLCDMFSIAYRQEDKEMVEAMRRAKDSLR